MRLGDWTCEDCGRDLNPVGDCTPCNREERNRLEAAGKKKRAQNLTLGDRFMKAFAYMYADAPTYLVETLTPITKSKRVIVNEGMGDKQIVLNDVEWVDMKA
jgi:hypothetical protein